MEDAMPYTLIKQLYENPSLYHNQRVTIGGFIRTLRSSKAISFMEITDGSYFKSIQAVLNEETSGFDDAGAYLTGAAVKLTGKIILTPEAKQPFEMKTEETELLAPCPADYPLQKKRHSLEYLRTIAHLRARTNTYYAAFKIRSVVSYAIHRFFNERGFVYIHTPIITTSDCEGAGEMFRVTTLPLGETDISKDFFGKDARLTVSGQLNGEAFCFPFRNIYTFGPTFRAENSNTPRHAAEFWMIEPEMAFCDLSMNMDMAEAMVKAIVSDTLANALPEMEFLNEFIEPGLIDRLKKLLEKNFARITYTEAVEHLEKADVPFVYPVTWGCDLQTEHEKYLTEQVYQGAVFVTDYPKEIKSFYMRQNDDGKTVAAMDLLLPGVGEIIGGSQREEREELLRQRMRELSLKEDSYSWYLDTRRFGGVYHSGYGLGLERILMVVTGLKNIRDVIPFPRTTGSASY
jgi:asparaginyl-tRNA synthetase